MNGFATLISQLRINIIQTAADADYVEPSQPPMFLRNINGDEFTVLNARTKGLVLSIRSLDAGIWGDDFKNLIAEMYPPGLLFDEAVRNFPNMYLELRNYVEERRVNLRQHSSVEP